MFEFSELIGVDPEVVFSVGYEVFVVFVCPGWWENEVLFGV